MQKGILQRIIIFFVIIIFFGGNTITFSQNVWTHKNNFPGLPRAGAVAFSIDTNNDGITDIAFMGAGWDQVSKVYNDFWKYDPTTDTWAQEANIGGSPRAGEPLSFGLHGMGYVGAGADTNYNGLQDLWQYNPQINAWTQKNNLPGLSGRWGVTSMKFNQTAFFGFGNYGSLTSPNIANDFWEYNDSSDTWDSLATFPGTPKYAAAGFSLDTNGDGIDDKIYVGPGIIAANTVTNNEFWEYDRTANMWTQKSNVPGPTRQVESAFGINGKGYLGLGAIDVGYVGDFYEYNPVKDTWTSISPYPGTPRGGTGTFTIADTGYIFGGMDGVVKNDLYKYVPFLNGRNTIRGNVFVDANNNCLPDSGEQKLSGWIIEALPGPYFASSDSNGNYVLNVDSGSYTIFEVPSNLQTTIGTVVCPGGISYPISFSGYGADTSGFNFGDTIKTCPYLTISIGSTGRRRCFNNLTVAHYCNQGFATAYNVQVYVKLPLYVHLASDSFYSGSDFAFTYDADSDMVFQIDSVLAGQCGDIHITDHVDCGDIQYLGLTACTEAWITPANTCLPSDSNWNRADLVATAACYSLDTVLLTVNNDGTGNMTDSTQYRIYLDQVQVFQGNLELASGATFTLKVLSGGQTVRIEADQPAHHPFTTEAIAWSEACGLNIPITVSRGDVTIFPTNDGNPQTDIDCIVIDGAWDPNEKLVKPVGLTSNHYVQPGTPLNYEIQFQNTGTDTAFTVSVTDSLSQYLDPSTLKITGSSNPYIMNISGKVNPVLTITFNKIDLPDSTVNLLGSNGFISFTIKPYDSVPLNSVISNVADIVFDFNPPVRTNQVFNTISNYVQQNLVGQISGNTLTYNGISNVNSGIGVSLFPNPTSGQFTIGFDKPIAGQTDLSLQDMTGRVLWNRSMSDIAPGNMPVNAGLLSKGVYIFMVRAADTQITKKLVVE